MTLTKYMLATLVITTALVGCNKQQAEKTTVTDASAQATNAAAGTKANAADATKPEATAETSASTNSADANAAANGDSATEATKATAGTNSADATNTATAETAPAEEKKPLPEYQEESKTTAIKAGENATPVETGVAPADAAKVPVSEQY